MSLYPYAEGDLLNNRNTYFYTSFEGRAFLDAWQESRDKIVTLYGQQEKCPKANASALPEELLGEIDRGEIVETGILLESLYVYLTDEKEPQSKAATCLIDNLVKRFEVTKRIHSAYGAGFKPVDKKAYVDYGLYVRMAEVLECAYSIFKKLPYLNVLLKCVDTLCSISEDLNPNQRSRLGRIIAEERRHVKDLAQSRGIEFET
ncbi:MAG: hypothetical protein ACUZ8N_15480 [Candidatus Scalindua sp.]